jgi:predicted nuclease of predicted toxin-antitoxin system
VKLLADESVDAPIVERLRLDGHEVVYVTEVSPGIEDDQVLNTANKNQSLLLTGDKDFGELVFRLGRVSCGVILVRLSGLAPPRKARVVSEAIRAHGNEMANAFTVVTPGMVRIRHQP